MLLTKWPPFTFMPTCAKVRVKIVQQNDGLELVPQNFFSIFVPLSKKKQEISGVFREIAHKDVCLLK